MEYQDRIPAREGVALDWYQVSNDPWENFADLKEVHRIRVNVKTYGDVKVLEEALTSPSDIVAPMLVFKERVRGDFPLPIAA